VPLGQISANSDAFRHRNGLATSAPLPRDLVRRVPEVECELGREWWDCASLRDPARTLWPGPQLAAAAAIG
jgi:hypothetical protein